jgi:acyl dehydratase
MNLSHVLARRFAPVLQAWDARDAALYALALGIGSDPLDHEELPYVFEGRGLRTVPSFCVTLGWPAFWQDDPATGIDWVHILHGEQHVRLHRPLPTQGQVRATHRIIAIEDKGPGRGALIHFGIELSEATNEAATNAVMNEPLASVRQVQFLRGDGGCGSWGSAPPPCTRLPADWQAEHHIDYRTAPQAALFYRLASRDMMPLHADPALAARAGYERPISHGLSNLGLACRAVLKQWLPGQPERLQAMSVRFAQPSYPGETIRIELRRDGAEVRFRAWALERQVLVLDRGRFLIADPP